MEKWISVNGPDVMVYSKLLFFLAPRKSGRGCYYGCGCYFSSGAGFCWSAGCFGFLFCSPFRVAGKLIRALTAFMGTMMITARPFSPRRVVLWQPGDYFDQFLIMQTVSSLSPPKIFDLVYHVLVLHNIFCRFWVV